MKSKQPSAVIAVVDDDESVRDALSSLLRSAGRSVITYASANDLLGDGRRARLKLIIADIQMPGVDGFAMLEAVKRWKRPVPVVFITAYSSPELSARALAAGALGVFSKPLDDVELLALISKILKN
jgi:FixJ family two-component response regulator